MPRGSSSTRARASRAKGTTATLVPENDTTPDTMENTVSAATDTDDDTAAFEIYSEPAPEDYQPDRKTPGRTRRPSYFDDVLRFSEVFGKGWQRVPVTSQEHKEYVLRELNRAKLYLNGTGKLPGEPEIGLDLDDKHDDAVYFKSRVAQKRARNTDALADNAEEDGTYDEDGDNDE